MHVDRVFVYWRRLLLFSILVLTSVIATAGAAQISAGPDKAEMRAKIGAIIRERTKGAVISVNGMRVETRIPPQPDAVKTIKGYGDEAVPVLADFSRSRNVRERQAAIEFLGLLGGKRIVAPLQKIIDSEAEPHLRILALRWITTAPDELSLPIIRASATHDANRQVREAAQSILNDH